MSRRRPLMGARFGVGLVLAAMALTSSVAPPPVSAASSLANAVSWSIDHSAKKITADVRITLTPTCSRTNPGTQDRGARVAQCEVTAEIAAQIKASIERIWNGHKYYCYDIAVQIDIQIDDNPLSADPDKRVKVRLDQTPARPVSTVPGRNRAAPWDGNSPSDALRPVNNGAASSTWAYPPAEQGANVYAHETGHILGLHDTYETDGVDEKGYQKFRTIPGAPEDLMSDQKNSNIHDSTLRRMVERAGYSKTDLKCNYKIDQPSFGGRITGQKCDPLGGTWLADGVYTIAGAKGRQTWIIEIDALTKRGKYSYTDEQVAEFALGIVVVTEGKASGEASLIIDDELRARLHLEEKSHTFVATTVGGPPAHDQNAPLISLDLVWEPIGKC